MERVDQKYGISAVNVVTGKSHNEFDSCLFLAHDPIFLKKALPAYLEGCKVKKCSKDQINRVKELIERVKQYQKEHPEEVKLPD